MLDRSRNEAYIMNVTVGRTIKPMTICIAAIATEKEKEHIVFATDHMVSTELGNFEHSIRKYKKISQSTVAMLAGNPFLFDDLVRIEKKDSSYEEIKKTIYENFNKKRKDIIQKELLDPIGTKYEAIFPTIVCHPQINDLMLSILSKAAKFNLDAVVLLVGFDGDDAQITEIRQDGISDYRMLNFHAIGSGNMQAANTLLFQKHDKKENLIPTIYHVYKAKRNAEVLRGVGKETDLLVINQENGCIELNEHLGTLGKVYEAELATGQTNKELYKIKERLIGGKKCI